jgi:DNA-binding NarL/FixJ family response regulator
MIMKKVYIVEENGIMDNAVGTVGDLLSELFPKLDVFESASAKPDIIEECIEHDPDLAIIDFRMPRQNGLKILHLLKSNLPRVKTIVYSGLSHRATVDVAIQGGADGFVNKKAGVKELAKAVNAVSTGGTYFSPLCV